MKAQQGITLMELLTVLIIISILAMVAIPSYQESAAKAHRTDAQSALAGLASALERHFTETGSYKGAAGTTSSPTDTGSPWIFSKHSPIEGTTKMYDLTIETATDSFYTIKATNISGNYGYLEMDSTSAQRWDKNNDGDTADTGETSWYN